MKNILSKGILHLIISLIFPMFVYAQTSLLSWSPNFVKETNINSVVITADATKGNTGLLGYTPTTDVYVHIGVITNLSTGPSNWKYVNSTWGTTTPAYNASNVATNKWQFTLPANLRTYFNITNPAEKIIKIAILFRNGAGTQKLANSDGSDMYIPVDTTGLLQVRINAPSSEPRYVPWVEPISAALGQPLAMQALSSDSANLDILLNGTSVTTSSFTNLINGNPTLTQSCANQIIATASLGTTIASDTLNFFIPPATNVAALPPGVQDGINYNSNNTEATFVLYAPGKQSAMFLYDANNWAQTCDAAMNITPDGSRFWKTISNLTPGQLYKFQYLVDNNILTTDPYTELVLDPFNDAAINASIYPNMPTYPSGRTGMVGTFRTGATPYNWTATNYVRPEKKNLFIYEVLLRDFIATHNWNGLTDSLEYLKKLGVNCIELMPFAEFEGNSSWGYNPDFFFAPDKYYGPAKDLKKFIDMAHSKGIAVVMDAVLNHVTGLSPLAALYWNGSTNKPTADNPWLNVDAKHDFNVFNDFNHESASTKYHVHRFIKHWLTEYKIDGFRWDLAKGFTQNNTLGNVGAWGNYDASRVAIWKNYYDSMQAASLNSYCILEFFGGDAEESELANYGMMIWGNGNYDWRQNTKGLNSSNNLNRQYYKNRTGYNLPHLISYAESHDEERQVYDALQNGNVQGSYNIKNLTTALKRIEAQQALFLTIPGPKMIWQFGELGYDYGINRCVNGTYNNNCRLDEKPIVWNYFNIASRKKIYNTVARMNALRTLKPNVFNDATIVTGTDLGSNLVKRVVLNHADLKVVSFANFDVKSNTFTHTFPSAGTWYNYLGTDSINATGASQSIFLNAGDYKVYLNQNINPLPKDITGLENIQTSNLYSVSLYPNPSNGIINLMLESKISGVAQIEIRDVQGKLIQSANNYTVKQGPQNILLPSINHVVAGLYVVSVSIDQLKQFIPLRKF